MSGNHVLLIFCLHYPAHSLTQTNTKELYGAENVPEWYCVCLACVRPWVQKKELWMDGDTRLDSAYRLRRHAGIGSKGDWIRLRIGSV
jgi:hypothetical protein